MSWDLHASAGIDGTSILWRGNWSSASSYNPYDAVFSVTDASSYISKTNNANKDPVNNPADWDLLASSSGSRFPRNHLAGLTLSNNATDAVNDIDIGEGECRDSTNSVDIVLPASMTKRLDAAWAVGTNQGGRDTGAIADTSWHIYVIMKEDQTTDIIMTATYGSPMMPSGYVYKRRLGSISRVSASIVGFKQLGDYFQFTTPVVAHNSATVTQNGTFLLVLVPYVPTGLKHLVDVQISHSHSVGGSSSQIGDPDITLPALGGMYTTAAGIGFYFRFQIWCNSSSQLRVTAGVQTGTFTYSSCPIGFWDWRDKDK